MSKTINFSPVTRLSGLLSVEVVVDQGCIIEANAKSTMFRGYEEIMQGRKVTDAVYMTQRVCGICSLAHGAVGSYLLDELYGNNLSKQAQYLRNIMYIADFLQNHIRHFYFFSLPDFVQMPDQPPWQGQNLTDARLKPEDNQRFVDNYFAAVKAAQEAHEILALFGGKAPHQHSFVQGGVAVAPSVDKITRAQALLSNIREFIKEKMIPDTKLLAKVYQDYYEIGVTPKRLISFGLFKFGEQNQNNYWPSGVIKGQQFSKPDFSKIEETAANSWFEEESGELKPDPDKANAYSWTKTVQYGGEFFETGPLSRLIIRKDYPLQTSTMDRIVARSLEALQISELMEEWLTKLKPGSAPIAQQQETVKNEVIAATDAMRGALLHSTKIEKEKVLNYQIITPTVWNFAPKDKLGNRGPVENALVGTKIPRANLLETILGRIIRSFDPCISCATHVLNLDGKLQEKIVF